MSSSGHEPARASILVVDDDPRSLLAIRAAFASDGHELLLVSSGADALRRLLEREFAVILLDVRMADLDGFETARLIRAREQNRYTPILFMSAFGQDDQEVREGYALGAVDFLFKPIVSEILRAKVSVFVELYRHAERLRQLERRANERKLLEERQRWEAEALRTENARKDEFLAVLSHELRNPLNALVLSVPLLRECLGESDARPLGALERQVKHLARLVDDLLDVGRISSGKILLRPRATTLASAVDQAIEMAAPLMRERHHTLRLLPSPDPIPLVADEARLTQIVCNLLSNASRYTDRGGRVEVAYGADAGQAWIRVTDNGRGIAPEMLPRIFELFVQERRNAKGLGVGLALARKLAELHSGTLIAQSDGHGCGSTFELRLPRILPDAGEIRSEAPLASPGKLRILVVDDNEDVRLVAATLLSLHGHRVDQAANGEEAVERAVADPPHVVLMDLAMPGLDGYSTAELLQQRLGAQTPPLIAMSGYSPLPGRGPSRDEVFAAHLLKPVDPDTLLNTLAELTAP